MFRKFCSYYKPHRKLFYLDLFCALLLSGINLIYPLIAKYIMNELAGDESKIKLINDIQDFIKLTEPPTQNLKEKIQVLKDMNELEYYK